MATRAAAQIGVTFGADEIVVLDELKAIHEATRAPISYIAKLALKAHLHPDKRVAAVAAEQLESMRKMASFSGAARLVARRQSA